MVRTDQGGSVLGFVVIGIVMAALLVGGIFAMQQQSRITPSPTPTPEQPAPQPQEQKPAEKPAEEQKEKPQPAPQPAPTQLPSNSPMHEMPQTGPAETIASAAAVLLVSGVLISYIRSRRQLASL